MTKINEKVYNMLINLFYKLQGKLVKWNKI